ncbi:MAG TPA: amino acid-binding protein [Verrucomicrobiae bacterium]|nr:amino acid-binding protein [Verrucomicrobiae bacterium]
MAFKTGRVDTWAATLEDRPGGLADKLGVLANAGVNLEFMIARRSPESPGKGVLFVTPIKGMAAARAARQAGFTPTASLHAVRVEGPNRPGQGQRIAQALAAQGLNLRGFSAAALGRKFVAHLALDSTAEARKALRILEAL